MFMLRIEEQMSF